MEICFKIKVSILDIENLRPLFRKKVDDKIDLLGLVVDLLRTEKIWFEGILENAFINS